ncbi:MAG: glutaredoxin family protein, partial [Deltaproteobacteria bacterium]|nr:glutaredoxin family protein [Deltaproteobacteria bacterium]
PRTNTPKNPALPQVGDGRGQMFIFFDRRAELRTVEHIAKVDPTARGAVQILDPAHPLAGDRILVADLRTQDRPGGYRRWVAHRGHWLAATMPKTSVLTAPHPATKASAAVAAVQRHAHRPKRPRPSRRDRHRPGRRAKPPRHRHAKKIVAAPASPQNGTEERVTPPKDPAHVLAIMTPKPRSKAPVVSLFGTTWCPSCRRARAYFLRRKVPFAYLDVEHDPRAAEHYRRVARGAGLRPGVVPVILVGKHAFQGFSEQRMEEVLRRLGILKANPSPK